MQEKATLKDIINYEPEEYLSRGELELIQNTFRGNKELMKVLRKVMIPTIYDPELPIEQLAHDFYFSKTQWSQIPADEAKILAVARQEALEFIIGGLIKLNVIANEKQELPEDKETREKKDSTK